MRCSHLNRALCARISSRIFQYPKPKNKKKQRMQTENGKIEGNVSINGSLQMNGMFTGDVTVENGAYLILNGMATQSVTLKKGGSLEVNGTVVGAIYNQGGSLVVRGMVKDIIEQI